MATNGRAAQSGMGVISAICSTWESQCQAGIRCTTTSSRLTHSTPTRSHFPPHSYKHVHGTGCTHYSTDSPNFFKQPSFSSPPTPNHHRWHVHRVCSVNHNPAQIQAPLFQFFPSGELRRCAIWFQAPAQLLLKTVGKHPGIRRICGTNSCPVVSARRLFLPLSFLFFKNICQDISWASTLSYCSSYTIRVGTFKAGYPLKWSGVIGKVFKCIGLMNILRHSSSLKVIVGVFLQKTSTKLLATHLELRAGFGLGFVYLDNLELKNYDARTNAWGLIWKISYYPSWKYACLALWGLTLNLLIF